jgi:ABC-type sugar transport system substrate-binding protein
MKKLKFLLCLTTHDNDYQIEQAHSAEQAATRLGVDLQILYADNDAVNQSTQILKVIQSDPRFHPTAVIFEPVGATALPQVARAAAAAGIGWAVLNRQTTYLNELRALTKAPVFNLSSNHTEIGRIQARQIAAFLPKGGSILYIQGPSENSAAKERTEGLLEIKPANIHAIFFKAQWTEESACRALQSWLKLSTSKKAAVDLIAAQNDAMAVGARKAFQELPDLERERWLALPFIGCDGLPNTGQSWVRSGLLAATVFVPPNAGQAIEMVTEAIQQNKILPEHVWTVPSSIPPLENLRPRISPL